MALNADKSSVEVPRGGAGEGVVGDLQRRADVVIVDLRPEELAALGLDEQFPQWPDLVVVRITGFGVDGPMGDLPSDSLLAEAYGGLGDRC